MGTKTDPKQTGGCCGILCLVLLVGWLIGAVKGCLGLNSEPAPTVSTSSPPARASNPLPSFGPDYTEEVKLPKVSGLGEATGGTMPPPREPVTVHLMSSKRIGSGMLPTHRWFFRVVNTSDKPWQGGIRIHLITENGTTLLREEFKTNEPISPGDAKVCPYFETSTGPVQLGGNITHYGWSVIRAQ